MSSAGAGGVDTVQSGMFQGVKQSIKENATLKRLALWSVRLAGACGGIANVCGIARYIRFIREWRQFRHAGGVADVLDWHPCLYDRTLTTGIDAHYFYQAVWAFRQIVAQNIRHHIDIGSQVNLVGLLSVVTRVTFLDIRPLVLTLPGYSGVGASLVALPFADGTVDSLSSLHVIEHIGLGRYGDPVDPQGTSKAAMEITRVMAPGGCAYISVPIGRTRVQFNGQRVFAANDVVAMFSGLQLVTMAMVDARGRYREDVKPGDADIGDVGAGSDCGLGLFLFRKPA